MRIMRYARPRVPAAVLLLCAWLSAQEEPSYTMRVNTDLVQIRVAARDRGGRFVRDLTRDEFEVMEDGRPQELSAADLETVGASNPGEVQAPPVDVAVLTSGARVAANSARGLRLVVLFFDFTSLDLSDAARSLHAAEAYVRTIGPADRVAVVISTPALKVQQDFTGSRQALQRALERLHGMSRAALETADDPSYRLFHAYERLRALRLLASSLAKVPQRKSVVIFGGGSAPDAGIAGITATVDTAVRAGVSFYCIDASGLTAAPPLGDASRASSFGAAVLSGVATVRSAGAPGDRDLLYALARGTGGRAFFDSNDFERPFRSLEADSSEYYVLSYRSSNSSSGHFRRISIRVRRRGIELKYPAGYYGPAGQGAMSAHDTERLIAEQLVAELPGVSVPVYGFVNHLRVGRDSYFLPITVLVPVAALLNNGTASAATVGLAVQDSRGKVVRKLRGKIPAADVSELTRYTVQFETAVELPGGEYNLRLVVVQNGTGQAGSFRTPIHLPHAERPPLAVSQLLTGKLAPPSPNSLKSPLVVNGSRLIVNPLAAYRVSSELTMQYQVECGDGACEPKETRSSLQCFQVDQPVFMAEPAASAVSGTAAVFRVNFPAAGLRPGTYTCRVTAVNPPANAFAFGSIQLRILDESQQGDVPGNRSVTGALPAAATARKED